MELLLMRHSTTPGNGEHRFVGTIDQPLSPEGAQLAASIGPLEPVEQVYRSPLLRCAQTAANLWPGCKPIVVEDLHEVDFGQFEGLKAADKQDDPNYLRWLQGCQEEGDVIEDCTERVTRGLLTVLADAREKGHEKIGIVAHGGVCMALLYRWAQPHKPRLHWLMPNSGGYRVNVTTDPLVITAIEMLGSPILPSYPGMVKEE